MKKRHRRFVLKRPFRLMLILLLITFLSLAPTLVSLLAVEETDYSVLDVSIITEMQQHRVPGLSLVIFKDQKIFYSKSYGVKNSQTGEPVDSATIFQGASFSKTLTAYAALILVERGVLSLDEPLQKYLKKPYLPKQRYDDRITLRMILNHTSGLSNDSDGKDRQIYFRPGALFSYSGAGFRYLQQVIEDLTEISFTEFMDQAIIKPLGMGSSSFVFMDELAHLMANGHEAGKVFPITKKKANAAYSLLTTAADMTKFNQELCRPTLVKPETVAQMLTPESKWKEDIFWGLGMGILKTPGEDFFWHWGNNYYYCSLMLTGKDSKFGTVIMTNGNTGMWLAGRLAVKIMNEFCLEPGNELNQDKFDFVI
ncbi:MAG: beta-lactamase family protein [Firmicutes bacterium]|nr:beta-lactamase family protein [Bacillota bacterium]